MISLWEWQPFLKLTFVIFIAIPLNKKRKNEAISVDAYKTSFFHPLLEWLQFKSKLILEKCTVVLNYLRKKVFTNIYCFHLAVYFGELVRIQSTSLILRHATNWGRVFCSLEALECIVITIGNDDFSRTVNQPNTCLNMLLNSLKMQIWRCSFSIFSCHVFYC